MPRMSIVNFKADAEFIKRLDAYVARFTRRELPEGMKASRSFVIRKLIEAGMAKAKPE